MYNSNKFFIPALYLRSITGIGILCPPHATLSATRCFASSTLSSQKNRRWTTYPLSCAFLTRFTYDLVANVVSIEKDSPASSKSSILFSIKRPASIATLSGLKGDKPLAISSALTNSFTSKDLGSIVLEAVVLPAPLQPAMMYKCRVISLAKVIIIIGIAQIPPEILLICTVGETRPFHKSAPLRRQFH